MERNDGDDTNPLGDAKSENSVESLHEIDHNVKSVNAINDAGNPSDDMEEIMLETDETPNANSSLNRDEKLHYDCRDSYSGANTPTIDGNDHDIIPYDYDGLTDAEPNDAVIKSNEKVLYSLSAKVSPRANAFFFSKFVSYFWMTSLFVKGTKGEIELEDLEGINPNDMLMPLTDKLEKNWRKEAYDRNGNIRQSASLTKTFIKTFGCQFMLIGILPVCVEIFQIVQPIVIGLLIEYFAIGSTVSTKQAYMYASILVMSFFCTSFCMIPYFYLRQLHGVHARLAVTGLIYKKVLVLSPKAIARTTTGTILNLVTNDSLKLELIPNYIHYLWIGPIELIVIVVLLWRELGEAVFAGIFVLLLLVPIQMVMGKILMGFKRKILKYSDERVKLMNEILSGMNVIKLYTWESSFAKLIRNVRKNEVRGMRHLSYLRSSILSFFVSSGALVSFVTFLVYILLGNAITARKVFTTLALFNVARIVCTIYFPFAIIFFMEGKVSLERIQKVLLEDELKQEQKLEASPESCAIIAENITASWVDELPTLKKISFNLKAGELLAIVGPVGSGKSSLLMSILGDLPLTNGELNVKGEIAYSSQEPWIFNGSLRYNITFGREFDEERYTQVLKVCALEEDIHQLQSGDMTLVGERGIALSGGQKARVNLARAVYTDADIYIFDDPLSAVDASVGKHLFEECINGYLREKTRILVTHQVQYLSDASCVMTLNGGECIGKGTYSELVASGIDFLTLVENKEEGKVTSQDFDRCSSVSPSHRRSQLSFKRQISKLSRQSSHMSGKSSFGFNPQESCNSDKSSILLSPVSILESEFSEDEEVEVLIPKETKQSGNINFNVFLRFYRSGYGVVAWVFLLLLFFITQAVFISADLWLATWTNKEESNPSLAQLERRRDLTIYTVLIVLVVVLALVSAMTFFKISLNATNHIHLKMFDSIMRAPKYFFDTNSIGRIMNRFSSDTGVLDDRIHIVMFASLQQLFQVIGILVLISINLPVILFLVVPMGVMFVMLRVYYIKTAREVQRIERVTRSPIFGHFSTTLLGLTSIRCFGAQKKFFEEFAQVQDIHTEAYTTFMGCTAWLAFNLDLMCGMFLTFCCFIVVILADQFSSGIVGLLLAYAISLPTIFQSFVKQSTELESQFTSVERMIEYVDLEPEAALETNVKPAADWPQRGSIHFNDLSLAYHKTLPTVLHSINAHIKSQEKIGVCGRTGAGKSSLLSTLFRTSEPRGAIHIDDVDIKQLGLKDLRSKLSIIPQEPVLFSGSMRRNLDPFDNHTDKEIWDALEEVQLKLAVMELPCKLNCEMAESGGNLSVGQKQLVCLARALLKQNKILVVDEATANVDIKTDALIQQTIRDKFRDCTVLTIAHRLNTIMDSDRIMVLDAGRLKEFDEPHVLLKSSHSILSSLVAQTGPIESQKLVETARKAHLKRKQAPS